MEVKFKCIENDTASITIKKEVNKIILTNEVYDLKGGSYLASIYLDKRQLSDFIGQLLHIQSNLNRR